MEKKYWRSGDVFMNSQVIASNSVAYVYDSLKEYVTNVFVIETLSKVFVIDTFCGSKFMEPIQSRINTHLNDKEVIVINTHFYWDHVWGNISFKGYDIISHELCRKVLEEQWEKQMESNHQYIEGSVEKCLPNVTFKDKLIFHEEGIELFYSPGHTADSISIFDHNERILYVGDNLEKPIIYVEHDDVATYIHTLKHYLTYQPKKIVAGHTLDLQEEDIHKTIDYLQGLSHGRQFSFQSEYERKIHDQNLKTLNMLEQK